MANHEQKGKERFFGSGDNSGYKKLEKHGQVHRLGIQSSQGGGNTPEMS